MDSTHLWLAGGLVAAAVACGVWPAFRSWIASMRTAIWILSLLAVFSLMGVLVGQNLPPEAYVERYGRLVGSLVARAGVGHIFDAWYFLLMVGVLAISIVACSLVRGAQLARRGGLSSLLRAGSLLTHMSFVLILAGGLVSGIGGFRRALPVYLGAGGVVEVEEGGFSLRVDDARMEFSETGAVSDYVSIVTVVADGAESGPHRIEVNHPLDVRGIGVYQYEMLPSSTSLESALLGVVVPREGDEPLHVEVEAPYGEEVGVPGTSLTLKVVEFLSHFTYDIDRGTAELASIRHENPAVLVQVAEDGVAVDGRWVFAGFPGHGGRLPCTLFLLDYAPDYRHALTRFEISRQPGTPLVYAGFILMSLGLCLTFWVRGSGRRRSANAKAQR